MLIALPAWIIDDAPSVREEVRQWRGTTSAARWHIAKLCSRDVMWAVMANEHPQRVLDQVDRLPDSLIKAPAPEPTGLRPSSAK